MAAADKPSIKKVAGFGNLWAFPAAIQPRGERPGRQWPSSDRLNALPARGRTR